VNLHLCYAPAVKRRFTPVLAAV